MSAKPTQVDLVLSFGKHKGKTVLQVVAEHYGYALHVLTRSESPEGQAVRSILGLYSAEEVEEARRRVAAMMARAGICPDPEFAPDPFGLQAFLDEINAVLFP